jgi:DNA-binding NtrC family response regulator
VKVLLVDDENDVIEFLTELLEDWGYEVQSAKSGNEALRLLAYKKFDILLTDVKMKDGDGMYLIKEMINEKIEVGKILVMTGYTQYPEEEFINLGAQHVFQKPMEAEELKDHLKSNVKVKNLDQIK